MLLTAFVATFLVAFAIGFVFACILALHGKNRDARVITHLESRLDQYISALSVRDATISGLRYDLVASDLQNSRLHRVLDLEIDGGAQCPDRDTHAALALAIVSDEAVGNDDVMAELRSLPTRQPAS